MNNKEKLALHLAKAEQWQAQIERYEAQADAQAEKQVKQRLYRNHDVNYLAKVILKDHFQYNRACANRNAAQAMVQMYSAAVQAGIL